MYRIAHSRHILGDAIILFEGLPGTNQNLLMISVIEKKTLDISLQNTFIYLILILYIMCLLSPYFPY
jgi:hypothetical protein